MFKTNSQTTVTFGEIMLRLAPPGFERLLQSPQFVATFGGGEALSLIHILISILFCRLWCFM